MCNYINHTRKKVSISARHFGSSALGTISELGKQLNVNLRYAYGAKNRATLEVEGVSKITLSC